MLSKKPKISRQTIEPLLFELSHKDTAKRQEAKDQLLRLEDNENIDSALMVELLFELNLNSQIYLIQALSRKADEKSYPFMAEFFGDCYEILLLTELLEAFKNLKTDYFIEAVLDKLNSKKRNGQKKFFGGWLSKKQEKETTEDSNQPEQKKASQAMIRFNCIIPALKYFQEAGNEKVLKFLEEMIGHQHPSVRYNALAVYKQRQLPFPKNRIIKINQNDSSEINRKFADLLLNPPGEDD